MKFLLDALLALYLTGCANFAHAGSAPSFSARASVSASFSRPTYVAPKVTYTAPIASQRVAVPVAPVVVRPAYVRPPGVHFWNNWYLYNYLYNRPVVQVGVTPDGMPVTVVRQYRPIYIGGSVLLFVLILLVLWAIYYRD